MAVTATLQDDAPEPASAELDEARRELAAEFLRGRGLEIGALHLRMWLPEGAEVRYVDRMGVGDLRHHYPELAALDLAPVDVVDDGERLETVTPESVDFIVANHFLEHCQDPIATITTHLTKLRPGGILLYAVPDKRYTFDFRRDRTPLQHIIDDHEHGAQRSRAEHYLQWASHVHEGTGPPSAEQAQAYAHQLEAEDYSIHFHVWTAADLTELMLHIQQRLDNFEIETIRRNGIENIVILRKAGAPEPLPPGLDSTEVRLPEPVARPATTVVGEHSRIPLAALRARRLPPEAEIHWSIDPDGATGRGLVQPVDTRYSIPLASARPARLEARVQLLPHDWRDGTQALLASVDGIGPEGARRLWSGEVRSAQAGGDELGVTVCCDLPAGLAEITLTIASPRRPAPLCVAVAVWIEPTIIDPHATEPSARVAPESQRGRDIARNDGRPLLSVLVPVHDPPLHMLREAVESVRVQTSDDWELCLVDDGSRDVQVIEALRAYAETDPRIRLQRRNDAGGISVATNTAMAMANGEYVALLDHDDLLVPNALQLVAEAIAADPELDMVYSDEAVVVDGRRVSQVLKPGWSPESFACHMYACHLGVYRRAIATEVGGFRPQYDGCQDYDFVLRFTEQTARVAHIPAQLYHWRAHTASTAGGGEAKPYAFLAQPRAIAEHLGRLGVDATVRFGAAPGLHRIAHRLSPHACVSAVRAIEDPNEVTTLARTFAEQNHQSWELVLGVPEALAAAVLVALDGIEQQPRSRISLVEVGDDMSGARALAAATAAATGDRLLLLERSIVGLASDWLETLVGWAGHPGVGAAGAVVLDADGRIAEAGYAFPEGVALPLLNGLPNPSAPPITLNVSAVGTVLATQRRVLDDLGMDPSWDRLMLVDYSLRAGEAGLRTVISPDARVQLTDAGLPGNDVDAIWRLRDAWAGRPADPLYNVNFRADLADYSPRQRL